jgi:polyisoprenyl-teichoic acid--peptidoglycan teichoic acid transferase
MLTLLLLPNQQPGKAATSSPLGALANLVPYSLGRPVNVLVMGIDEALDIPADARERFDGRSDTMLVMRFDPQAGSTNLLQIPRDTQVEVSGHGVMKINGANALGGPALAADLVSSTLNGTSIDRYVRVSTGAFRALVDLVGGIEVFVPKDMVYEDRTQNLYIDLRQGNQTLDGKQAEQFARFRHDEWGDIGRVQRQQMLLKALRQKLTNPLLLPRLPQIVQTMQQYIDTNLSPEETLSLLSVLLKQDLGQLRMVMLPGQPSGQEYAVSYWLLDTQARDRLVQEFFQTPPSFSGFGTPPSTVTAMDPKQLYIAVQDATGTPQVASQAAEELIRQGFQHVYVIDPWPETQAKTQILVQRGDVQGAQHLNQNLGVGTVDVISAGDLGSDLTLRLGNDWLQRPTPSSNTP